MTPTKRGTYYILVRHEPRAVDVMTWAHWMERKRGKRHVALDDVGEVKVSTVFLGIDHNFYEKGPPLLFETMIFGGPHDQCQWRYPTWEAAQAGHARALYLVRELVAP